MKVSYQKLDDFGKRTIANNLEIRKRNFLKALTNPQWEKGKILIIGDRPGPSAPTDPSYHHTPFYSTKHCSGWLNTALYLAQIPEDRLIWINSADKDGRPLDYSILEKLDADKIICLGGNAEKWYKKASEFGYEYVKFDHPQYWKRFKNSEEYPLIEFLQCELGLKTLDEGEYF